VRQGRPASRDETLDRGALGRVFTEEELAVVVAEEGEAVQVRAQGLRAVGRVPDVGQERLTESCGVGGEPAGDELEGTASSIASAVPVRVRGMTVPGLVLAGGAGDGEAVGLGASLDGVAPQG
jgi:hypothetical protein